MSLDQKRDMLANSGLTIDDAAEVLRRAGYTVIKLEIPKGHVRPIDFARTLDLNIQTVLKRLNHPDCPKVDREVGPGGKLKSFKITEEVFTFLAQNPQPGRRLRNNGPTRRYPAIDSLTKQRA